MQIIVLPAPGVAPADRQAWEAAGTTARVRLRLLRPIGPKLYLLELDSSEADPDCKAAIARLQADSRFLSVERDVRRQRQGSTVPASGYTAH
jgi:hypothetical protein